MGEGWQREQVGEDMTNSLLFAKPLQCPICKKEMYCKSHNEYKKQARFECPSGHNWYLEYLGEKKDEKT